MIISNLSTDELITLNEARRAIPSRPKPSIASLFRWCTAGSRGITLDHVRIGRRIFTTRQALDRFIQERTEAEQQQLANARAIRDRAARYVGSTKREHEIAGAKERLASAGVK